MNGNVILTIIAAANASLIATLIFLVFIDKKRKTKNSNISTFEQTAIIDQVQPNVHASINKQTIDIDNLDYNTRVKMALAWLESGIEAEVVSRELGFSSRETEVLVASASRTSALMLQNETRQLKQN